MERQINPFVWEEDFPTVSGHTSISFLKHCLGYDEAKNGNIDAAHLVVNECVKPQQIAELKSKYPNAVLLPVITGNRIPEAFAEKIGMKMYLGICGQNNSPRKNMSSMERLLHKPQFAGQVTKGETYIIIDDILTQGGTVSALRKHVISCGGYVAAVTTLSYAAGSQFLAPRFQDISAVDKKFTLPLITNILRNYRIADCVQELTRSEIRYLLRFDDIDEIQRKISKCLEIKNTPTSIAKVNP